MVLEYEFGELWLYQLDGGESLGPSTLVTLLNAEDWGVMKMMINMVVSRNKKGEEDMSDKENVDVTMFDTDSCSEEAEVEVGEEEKKKENGKRPLRKTGKRPTTGIRFNDAELGKLKIILG
ncbi:uncharacterized protein LOC126386266 [Scomber scombrus]|uniref:Uncharacterized protein LOC126386266 n=1 Tax=Scomber scombrus TaxID=13677 RepID=A0AAV1NPC6_SCOSC